MTQDEIVKMAREAGIFTGGHPMNSWSVYPSDLERFAALVAQRERDELVVLFLEAHEGAKTAHNYWAVAANKIKERSA